MITERRKQKNRLWQGVLRLFLVLALILGCQSPVKVQAADPGAVQQKATTGTLGENGGITWSYDAGKKTLTVSGEDELHGGFDNNYFIASPFRSICEENKVERMVFQDCRLKGRAIYLFGFLTDIKELDLGGLDTGNVTDMIGMFYGCEGLTSVDVSGFDTKNVTRMDSMFADCSGLTSLNVSGFDTGKVKGMSGMFYGCEGLTSVDVSRLVTGNVTDMCALFYGCEGLTSVDVSGFDTENVTEMYGMFYGCEGLTSLDVSGFDTGKVTDMRYMFYGCEGLTSLNISGFDIGSETKTDEMFSGCIPAVLKAPKTVNQEISLDVSYRDTEGHVYTALTAENAGKALKRADLVFYEIRFNGNGSTGGSTAKLTDCEGGKSYTLPANKFKRTGYTFTGWNTKKDGSGTAYANKATVKDLTKKNGATVTLYAQWKKNSAVNYKIKFNGNGATSGKMSDLKCKTGKNYQLPANAFKKQGYTFAGWNTKKDGTGKSFKNKASVKNLTKKSGDTVTLYAQWKPNTYTVKFDGNKATGGKMKDMENCRYDKSFKLTKSAYKRKGYTFAGWNTKKNGTGKSYKNGAQVKNLTAKNKGTVVLYAQWIKKK